MNTDVLDREDSTSEAPRFTSADNLALDQLRLENLYLRQRLHALARFDSAWRRAARPRPVDEEHLAA